MPIMEGWHSHPARHCQLQWHTFSIRKALHAMGCRHAGSNTENLPLFGTGFQIL